MDDKKSYLNNLFKDELFTFTKNGYSLHASDVLLRYAFKGFIIEKIQLGFDPDTQDFGAVKKEAKNLVIQMLSDLLDPGMGKPSTLCPEVEPVLSGRDGQAGKEGRVEYMQESIGKKPVTWSENTEGFWECSGCDITWIFESGGPTENGVNFCPKCGSPIGKILYPKYYMDCTNDGCGWSGLAGWNDKCPECRSEIEPSNEPLVKP